MAVDDWLTCRIATDELELHRAAAEASDMNLSCYVRTTLRTQSAAVLAAADDEPADSEADDE